MAYCSEDDLLKMIPQLDSELAELTAESGEVPDSLIIVDAISKAESEIDSYLGVKYEVPLAAAPAQAMALAVGPGHLPPLFPIVLAGAFGSVVFSPRTATVSLTTTTPSKSIKLIWTAIPGYSPTAVEGNCYHILRNTSDSFLDTDRGPGDDRWRVTPSPGKSPALPSPTPGRPR